MYGQSMHIGEVISMSWFETFARKEREKQAQEYVRRLREDYQKELLAEMELRR